MALMKYRFDKHILRQVPFRSTHYWVGALRRETRSSPINGWSALLAQIVNGPGEYERETVRPEDVGRPTHSRWIDIYTVRSQQDGRRWKEMGLDVSVDGRPICVTLCDTAGQDALDPLRQLCYPGTDVFLLCFSVVQPESFRSLASKWAPEVSKLRGAVVLVEPNPICGTTGIQGEKPVPVSAAWDFARKIGAKYIETSSHRKERIKETFDTAIWDVLQAREFNRKRPLWKRLMCLTC
nr:ras-like GTP-binding protein Rho1 [Aedes albopictus]